MDIVRVVSDLVCTTKVAGLHSCSLRVLETSSGGRAVAVDPVGTRPGDWVFTVSGSAARYATGNFDTHTDLTIGGIIDFWEDASPAQHSEQAG